GEAALFVAALRRRFPLAARAYGFALVSDGAALSAAAFRRLGRRDCRADPGFGPTRQHPVAAASLGLKNNAGPDGERRRPLSESPSRARRFRGALTSERQEDAQRLLTPWRLLDVGNRSLAAVSNARLGDLGQIDSVVALDIFGPHHTRDQEFTHFRIQPDFLLAFDH